MAIFLALISLAVIAHSSHCFSWTVFGQAVSSQSYKCRLTWIVVGFISQVFMSFSGIWSGFHPKFLSFSPYPTLPSIFPSTESIIVMGAWNGARGWVVELCQQLMGAAFYLGAGWPQWNPLDTLTRHPPPILARQLDLTLKKV